MLNQRLELAIMLLMVMAGLIHGTEPNDGCLTEERYKNVSYVNIINITDATLEEIKKDFSDLKETLKEEMEMMKDRQIHLEKIILTISDSLSSLSTKISPLITGKSITEPPITTSTPITVSYEDQNTELDCNNHEFYEAARAGNTDYITTQLKQGNSNSCSRLSMVTWANEEDNDRTALHVAAAEGHGPVVLDLLEAGANPNAKDRYGSIPVHEAAYRGHTATLQLLLQPKYYAQGNITDLINMQNDAGSSPISNAANNGHTNILDYLIAHDGNVHTVDYEGRSPLIRASGWGHVGAAQALINAGALLGHADDDGDTALHVAASENYPDVVRLLLQNGADKSQRDKYGSTPVDEARQRGHRDIASLINNWQ